MGSRGQSSLIPRTGVHVHLLGGFGVDIDDRAVPDDAWRLRKAKTLVKLLALAEGHRLHREQAIQLLWPDRAPAAAANNLHQVLHVARRQLDRGDGGARHLRLDDDVLTLGGEGALLIDVDVFRREAMAALRSGDQESARAALELYRGQLLPEDLYEEWTEPTRGELERLRGELALLADGDGPSEVATGARDNLPSELTTFIGREAELGEVAQLMRRGPLLTLTGAAGCGKTRLALEAAARQRDQFRHGVWLVELAPLSRPELVADAIAAALGVTLGRRSSQAALIEWLTAREVLIVLDNCEHLVAACASLTEALVRACPELQVLATSREPLHLTGEIVWRVPSLTLPGRADSAAPEELMRSESVRLFVDRAAAVRSGFALTTDNSTDVATICHRLDGVPLAIELAAARTAAMPAAEIARRLGDSFRLLGQGRRTAQTRQQTLEAALDWSYRLLDEDEAALLRRLSVFAGTVGLDAIERVCAGEDPVEVLVRLVSKSLVVAEEAAGTPRYRLLEMVRQYARERLAESRELDTLRERHARWYAELPALLEDLPGSEFRLRRLDLEPDNFRAALAWLLDHDPPAALRLTGVLGTWWLLRGRLVEGREWLESAVERTPQTTAAAAAALLRAVPFAARAGDMTDASRLAERSLSIYRTLGDRLGTSQALHMLGLQAWLVGDYAGATKLLSEADTEARLARSPAAEANATHALALVAICTGDLSGARSRLDRALELLGSVPVDSRAAFLVVTLGIVPFAARGGRVRLVVQEEAQITFRGAGPRAAAAYVRLNLALLARLEDDPARAEVLLGDALARLRAESDDAGIALTLSAIGRYAILEEDVDRAKEALLESLALRRRLGDVRGVGVSLALLAELAAAGGEIDHGRSLLERARAMLEEVGDRPALLWILTALAHVELATDQPDAARRRLETALAICEELGAHSMRGWTLASLAEADLRAAAPKRASQLLEQARREFEHCGSPWGIERCDALAREFP